MRYTSPGRHDASARARLATWPSAGDGSPGRVHSMHELSTAPPCVHVRPFAAASLVKTPTTTTASADFCSVTLPIARRRAPTPRCASLPRSLAKGGQPPPAPGPCSTSRPFWFFAHHNLGAHAEQISPNKNMRLRCTTAAFTLSAEPSGFVVWCRLARRPSLLCGSCSSARNFALGLPSGKPSRPCPCPRLVVILIASSSPTADFHRISSCPCRAYTSGSSGRPASGAGRFPPRCALRPPLSHIVGPLVKKWGTRE